MNLTKYLDYIGECDRNRSLMSRILLNTLGHAHAFPVDISELRYLSPENRAITNAFEEWAHSRPGLIMEGVNLPVIESWARRGNPRVAIQNDGKETAAPVRPLCE